MTVFWARMAPAGGDLYDAAAQAENQNQALASGAVDYEFTLFDELGLVARKTGTTFIYPQERLYIVEPALRTARKPVRVEFRILHTAWRLGRESPPQIVVERRGYEMAGEGIRRYSVADADIFNASPFGIRSFETTIALFDTAGNLIGVNKVSGENLAAGGRAKIKSLWPSALADTIGTIEVIPRVNMFDPDVIVKPQ
jgi:hypothetical protein